MTTERCFLRPEMDSRSSQRLDKGQERAKPDLAVLENLAAGPGGSWPNHLWANCHLTTQLVSRARGLSQTAV